MDEVKSSFFDNEIVPLAESNLSLDEWKAFYIYSEYLCEFPSPKNWETCLKMIFLIMTVL